MKFKSVAETKFDLVSLGEVMLRLDPGESRIRAAREFRLNLSSGLTLIK
jgi:2-dehydro-3-deoxygluconokinase